MIDEMCVKTLWHFGTYTEKCLQWKSKQNEKWTNIAIEAHPFQRIQMHFD